LIPMQLKRNH